MDNLDEDSFDAFVARDVICFVVFGAHNCRPFRDQLAEMRDSADDYAPARFASIDVLTYDRPRRQMNIRCLPTTVMFRDGRTLVGYQPRSRLKAMVQREIGPPLALAA